MTERPQILGIPADPISFEQLLAQIGVWISQHGGQCRQICTINPEFLVMAQQNLDFRGVLLRSSLNIIDGWGAVWALRRQGVAVPERVTGSDGVPLIAERSAREGWRLFLLGAAEGVAGEVAAIFHARYPAIQIVGVYAGSPHPDDEDEILRRVNAAQPDILLVAYGAPAQDLWIDRHLPRLNVAVAIGVGGTFDFIAGRIPRAPRWMRQNRLEWLFRLYKQPSRWRRMLRLPVFVYLVLRYGAGAPASKSEELNDNN